MSKALDQVLDLLDLEQIEVDIFRGRSPEGERRQRVFGGQVAGQALVAAGRTVPEDRPVHSLHAYFIRPGDPAVPLIYLVERVRDGRSFTTRRVTAIQHGKTIFTLSASFHRDEPGVEHADPMPDVPPPDAIPTTAERMEKLFGPSVREWFGGNPIDIRHIGPLTFEAERDPSLRTTRNLVWLRADGDLPDDPLLHVCLMTYASDMTLLDSVLLAHGLSWADGRTTGPASITRCGSTGRSAPTGGCCTRRTHRSPAEPRGLARGEMYTSDGDTRGLRGAGGADSHLPGQPGESAAAAEIARRKTSCPAAAGLRRLLPCPRVYRRRLMEGGAQDAEPGLGSRGRD